MAKIKFGWIVLVSGMPETDGAPLAIYQQDKILPVVAEHFDSLWVFDHFYGFRQPTDAYLESWTALTWLAARFPRVKIGTIVLGVGYRHPPLLAKMSASLQALSGGRLILGIGAGWRTEEYDAYGYPFPKPAVRVKQLEEAITIIRKMWTETTPSYKGEYYEIEQAYCPPRPDPQPPIMIGGEGEQLMLPLIARQADWWNIEPTSPGEYQRKRDIVHRHAEAAGRDPGDIVQTMLKRGIELPETTADSARLIEELQPLVELGVTYFMFNWGHVTTTEPIVRFAEEVIKPLNQA